MTGRRVGTPAKAPSQARRAFTLLREMLISNRLPPGAMYLESELADVQGIAPERAACPSVSAIDRRLSPSALRSAIGSLSAGERFA